MNRGRAAFLFTAFLAACFAALAHPAPRSLPASSSSAASPAPTPIPAQAKPLRLLFAFDEYPWVADTAALKRKLAFARRLGYNGLVCHLSATPPARAGDSVPWARGPESGCRWRLTGSAGAGRPGGRQAFIGKARSLERIAKRYGMEFIPLAGDMGWGLQYASIDPGTLAGQYLEMRIPDGRENLLRDSSGRGVVSRDGGWGDAVGSLAYDTASGDRGSVKVVLRRPGLFAAHWRIEAPWDGYLDWRIPVSSNGRADSASLKVYALYPGRPHVTAFRLLKEAGARTGRPDPKKGRAESKQDRTPLEAGFFVKRGKTYFVDLEYRSSDPAGGSLVAGPGLLARSVPPREELIDTKGYESPMRPGQPACLDYLAAHGHPEEEGMRTLISSRSPPLKEVPWFRLEGPRADSAWASMESIRGTFRDGSPESRLRLPIDPLAPASRQITAALFDALAEALECGYVHLGADEVFSLGRSRRQSTPASVAAGPAGLFARMVRERVAQADSAFAKRRPGKPLPAYLIYGDMLSRLSGIEEGTLPALDSLAATPGLRGRLIFMPWYYPEHLVRPLYPRTPALDAQSPEAAFLSVLREDAARFGAAGFDFLGIYSTVGDLGGLKEQAQGAEAWARVCGERASSPKGRCLGLAYSGWDPEPRSSWGSPYNGLLMMARSWGGSPALAVDADGDGVLDSLRGAEASR